MCGISGVYNFKSNNPVDVQELKNSIELQSHRGPNSKNHLIDRVFGSAMARLSIIALDSDCPPYKSASDRFSIVFNGEIFNYKEIRKSLAHYNYPFRSESDTETLLAMYDLQIENPEQQLIGMYAYAIFDHLSGCLTLCRDRQGEKPLFYSITRDGIIFASELKSFQAFSAFESSPNLASISNFLSLSYTPGPDTAFEGVYEVSPSTIFRIDSRGSIESKKYWSLDGISINPDLNDRKVLLEELSNSFSSAIKYRMVSDVPVGMFLSGGLDSSLCLAFAQKQSPRFPIKAYTIGFDSAIEDEVKYAKIVAKHFDVEHRVVRLTPESIINDFSRIIYCSDNLLANPAMFANYQLSKVAGKEIRVTLNGGGGDELFYGYPTYQADVLHKALGPLRYFSQALQWTPSMFKAHHRGISLHYKLSKFIEGLSFDSDKAHYWWRTIFSDLEKTSGFKGKVSSSDSFQYCRAHYDFNLTNDLIRFADSDLSLWWRYMGLYQADTMSMANSLELRVPMMDHRFIEFARSIPLKRKFAFGKTKPLIREFAELILPSEIFNLKKKGFHIPLNEWLCSSLKEFMMDNLSEQRLKRLDFISPAFVSRLIDDHLNKISDNSYKLINLIVLLEWYDQFFLAKRSKI
ncbi:MAG: asparagine synthase (glutamine-hydrolyzing) [Bdellovibrionales bacterium]|nr:asparagine synthase (glutamine-hydrolyzing) [Bdellovibrionales bacterium]